MNKEIKKRILRGLYGEEKSYEDVLRENAIKLAKYHKKYCEGENCDISLFLLRELLLGKYRIELTKEEENIFL